MTPLSPEPHDPAASSPPLCLLHLSLPQALETALLDALQAQPGLPPLNVWPAQQLGPGVPLPSALEQVHGRARRSLVQLMLPTADVPARLQALRAALPHPDVHWWTTPVLAHGSLT
ncbi:DUF3240 family protein [Curvibacter sp. HBC61]|uniref:DUF3240 family protein n=1 Tax=Curvibacter cyanobacteriorum TaxID=3026422 RepID=A0ABT5N1M0_9BURK|nr:DUF3240 family protein [Curvibacter sp. HBC61]MDD0839561.1 DUF3240 family protein [Curvibacter sp. HBC61]